MPYVKRDKQGSIVAVSQEPGPGFAEELREDDLAVAGMDSAAKEKLFDPNVEPRDKWRAVAPYAGVVWDVLAPVLVVGLCAAVLVPVFARACRSGA